jgi:hypothetical protein
MQSIHAPYPADRWTWQRAGSHIPNPAQLRTRVRKQGRRRKSKRSIGILHDPTQVCTDSDLF